MRIAIYYRATCESKSVLCGTGRLIWLCLSSDMSSLDVELPQKQVSPVEPADESFPFISFFINFHTILDVHWFKVK